MIPLKRITAAFLLVFTLGDPDRYTGRVRDFCARWGPKS